MDINAPQEARFVVHSRLKMAAKLKAGKQSGSKSNGTRANGSGKTRARKSVPPSSNIYVPSDNEPFMNDRQKTYFREKLLAWKQDILREGRETLQSLQDENANLPDVADRASSETDRSLELRTRDRQRKLIAKIDAALKRIEDGSYGYCDETGEPISLKRLDARPIATLSLEAQEMHERRERVYRND